MATTFPPHQSPDLSLSQRLMRQGPLLCARSNGLCYTTAIWHAARRLRTGLLSVLVCLVASALTPPVFAQPPDEPLESPKAVVSQVLGTTPITITYWSPGVKGRTIWGELVPFGQPWRAGANGKTTIEFSRPVLVGETRIEAGTYGLYVVPHSDERWELVLNRDPLGSPNEFEATGDVLRYTVAPERAPLRERLQYAIENFSDWPPFTAEIALHWERRRVVLPVQLVEPRPEPGD